MAEYQDFTSSLTGEEIEARLLAVPNKVDKEEGKGLSSNDYTAVEKTKLAGIEQGAEKNVNPDWNATSGKAQILNKPDLSDLTALIDRKAGMLIDTASGAIASFVPDSTIDNLLGVSVAVEPVQDLHGQASPWPAGGGVNLLPKLTAGTYQANGGKIVVDSNGLATMSGTTTAAGNVAIIPLEKSVTVTDQWYLQLHNTVANANVSANFESASYVSVDSPSFNVVDRIMQISASGVGKVIDQVRFYIPSGVTLSGTFQPMLTVSGTAVPYAPYENLCPISGWDAVGIEAAGENLLELDNASNPNRVAYTYTTETAEKVIATKATGGGSFFAQYKLSVKAGETYTFALDSYSVGGVVQQTANIYLYSDRLWGTSVKGNWNVPTGGAQWTATYTGTVVVGVFTTVAANTAIELSGFQCTRGTVKAAFRPYTGNTYTIQLGQTVYGGTPDVEAGTMTVDRAMVDLGTLAWGLTSDGLFYTDSLAGNIKPANWNTEVTESICSVYVASTGSLVYQKRADCAFGLDGNGRMYVYDSTKATMTAAEFKAAMSGVQLAYILKTPNEITITPAQIAAIAGQTNNVWADAGDVSVEYAADLKHYIDSKIAAAVAALS